MLQQVFPQKKKKKKKKFVTTSGMGTDQILKLLTYKFMELTFKNIYTW